MSWNASFTPTGVLLALTAAVTVIADCVCVSSYDGLIVTLLTLGSTPRLVGLSCSNA